MNFLHLLATDLLPCEGVPFRLTVQVHLLTQHRQTRARVEVHPLGKTRGCNAKGGHISKKREKRQKQKPQNYYDSVHTPRGITSLNPFHKIV